MSEQSQSNGQAVAERPEFSERDQTVFELVVNGGVSVRQAAKQLAEVGRRRNMGDDWSITYGTVARIVRRMLDELTEERREGTEAIRSKQVAQGDRLIQMAMTIARGQTCPTCDGNKTLMNDPEDPSAGRCLCPRCDGTGQAFNEDVRLRAMATVVRVQERQARLQGLDRPTEVSGPGGAAIPVAVDVDSLTARQLEEEVRGFFAAGGEVVDLPPEAVVDLGSADSGDTSSSQDQGEDLGSAESGSQHLQPGAGTAESGTD